MQGLRALAVLVVIANHLFQWPGGGFVGVDVFFVISGFLITGLLLREHERTGRISFAGFYRRRARRILPAVALVLTVTVALSWFVFGASRRVAITGDAARALIFAGNWRFAALSTDYFEQNRAISPVQHFWSLGVEEQFYLVWPWVLLLVFVLLARLGRPERGRFAAGLGIAVLSAGSLAWALWETSAVPGRAYFSTFSRGWELGVGALLAVLAPLCQRIPDRLRPLLAWVGLIALAVSVIAIVPQSGFPAPIALWPVLATALIIGAGTQASGQARLLAPLTNPVSTYFGDISFSLYLWHFPVIVIGEALFGRSPVLVVMYALVLVLAAVYSYHLLEDPVRHSGWLEPRLARHRHRRSRRHRRPRSRVRAPWLTPRYKLTALSAFVVLDIALVAGVLAAGPHRGTEAALSVDPPSSTVSTGDATTSTSRNLPPKLAALQSDIGTALQATTWPRLSPSLDEIAEQKEDPDVLTCGFEDLPVSACTWGDPQPDHTAVVVGDSISMSYVQALRAAIGTDRGWNLVSLGGYGCTFVDAEVQSLADAAKSCPQRRAKAVDTINRIKPDVVFVANLYALRTRLGDRAPMTAGQQQQAQASQLNKLHTGAKVVLLAAPPSEKAIESCYTKTGGPQRCVSGVSTAWRAIAQSDRALAHETGATFVDSRDWFCQAERCPSFVGSTPTKRDDVHLTKEYAVRIAPVMVERLQSLKILTSS